VQEDSEEQEPQEEEEEEDDAVAVGKTATGNLSLRLRLDDDSLSWPEVELLEKFSEGSFGMVYRGRFRGREVAVKKMIFVSGEAMTKERLRNVARELNSYRRLRHPNIVGYYGTVNDWPNLGLVTELVRGGNNWRCAHTHHLSFLYVYQFWCFEGNLFELMYERGVEFSAADRIKFANQLTIAVCHLHAADPVVVHRDLKTGGLLVVLRCFHIAVSHCRINRELPD